MLMYVRNLSLRDSRDDALYEAVRRSDTAAVMQRLREHADLNARAPASSSFSWRFWQRSAADSRASVLRCAVEQAVMRSVESGGNRLSGASEQQAIVIALLDAGTHADPHDGGENLLEWTLATHLSLATKALLKHGAPLPSALDGRPLLAGAINCNNPPETIGALLQAGANAKGADGRAALTEAYGQQNVLQARRQDVLPILQSLLEAGADPNTPIRQSTMLYDAVRWRHAEIAQLLLQAHADPNASPSGEEPLLFVALDNKPEVLQWLLDAGADPNVHERNGEPVLWYAVIHSISEPDRDKARKVELLLNHGANVHTRFATTEYGPTTVQEAARRGAKDYHINPSIQNLLLSRPRRTNRPRPLR